MTRTTITSVRGMPLPNLKAMGLHKDMKPLAALIDEQDKLRRRAQELGYKRQELQEQIKRLEHERTRQWGGRHTRRRGGAHRGGHRASKEAPRGGQAGERSTEARRGAR